MSPRRVWPLVLLVCMVACASPAPPPRDTRAAGEEPAPRFATGGPGAGERGAGAGYPKGDRTTFYDVERIVGSHSHLDEIFQVRVIHKGRRPRASRGSPSRASPGNSRAST